MLISVIIPVFNAEKTISRCLDSLVEQDYSSFEIILVNDGSTDESGIICKKYAQEYSQIKYIFKENGGVSSARNRGLYAACGDFITFVDSDDFVSEDYFYSIDKVIKQYHYDLIIFSRTNVNESTFSKCTLSEFQSTDKNEIIDELSNHIINSVINSPCSKVYKSTIIKKYNIQYPEDLSIAEDWLFNFRYAINITSLYVSECSIYYVNLDNQYSLSRRYNPNLLKQIDLSDKYADICLINSSLTSEQKQLLITANNFGKYRRVYAEDKRMIKSGIKHSDRLHKIKNMCQHIYDNKLEYPKTLRCKIICIPVRLRLHFLIDLMVNIVSKI